MYFSVLAATGAYKNKTTMAKTNTTKTAPKKSAAREFAEQDSAAAAPAVKATRNRGKVLVKITASKLHDLIGDTPIGVSRKELAAIVTKASSAKVLADAGL